MRKRHCQLLDKNLNIVESQLLAELLDLRSIDVSIQNMLQFITALRADGPSIGDKVRDEESIVHHWVVLRRRAMHVKRLQSRKHDEATGWRWLVVRVQQQA